MMHLTEEATDDGHVGGHGHGGNGNGKLPKEERGAAQVIYRYLWVQGSVSWPPGVGGWGARGAVLWWGWGRGLGTSPTAEPCLPRSFQSRRIRAKYSQLLMRPWLLQHSRLLLLLCATWTRVVVCSLLASLSCVGDAQRPLLLKATPVSPPSRWVCANGRLNMCGSRYMVC